MLSIRFCSKAGQVYMEFACNMATLKGLKLQTDIALMFFLVISSESSALGSTALAAANYLHNNKIKLSQIQLP